MTDHYEAVQLPRGNVVISFPSRDLVGAFDSMEEAEAFARFKNRWLESEPAPGDSVNEPMEWGDDWEARLMAIIDKPDVVEGLAA
jgi:hypothetical protein